MFVIEDEFHCELIGEYSTRGEAVAELRRLTDLRWDEEPNQAPCTSWRTCHRDYELIEYDDSTTPWRTVHRSPALKVSAQGAEWLLEPD
ncbi:MAG TPA: hypothetical protein VGL66_08740 [Caulobacteraceae bacterium]|jgi:hypothetical protein